jgi:hypothetical protein
MKIAGLVGRTGRQHARAPAPEAAIYNPISNPIKGRRRKEKKSDVPTYLPFLRFFEVFRSDLRKCFYGVFGLLMQRNGQKRDKTKPMGKDERKRVFFP